MKDRRTLFFPLIIIFFMALPSCKKIGKILNPDLEDAQLHTVKQAGKLIPADIDISDLLKVYPRVINTSIGPIKLLEGMSQIERVSKVVHGFNNGAVWRCPIKGTKEIWFGTVEFLPALSQRGVNRWGWYMMRIEYPEADYDKPKKSKRVDESVYFPCVVFHYEYYAKDMETIPVYDFTKGLVQGKTFSKDDPIVKFLYEFRGGGAYGAIRTAGRSAVVIHEKPLTDMSSFNKCAPLYLRRRGNRLYGIQRTKTGDTTLPFEHITGIYYELYRVKVR